MISLSGLSLASQNSLRCVYVELKFEMTLLPPGENAVAVHIRDEVRVVLSHHITHSG